MDDVALPVQPRRGGSQKRQRARTVRVACTEAEYAAIIIAAARAGLSSAAFMRRQAIGAPGPRSVRLPHPDKQALARVLASLGAVGSNVNQLARIANTTGELPAVEQLAATHAAIMEMRGALFRALGYGD